MALSKINSPTLSFALPSNDDHSVDVALFAQIDHPDGVFDEVVIENSASMQGRLQITIDSQRSASILPIFPQMALVIEPRIVVIGQVLHYIDIEKKMKKKENMTNQEKKGNRKSS